MNSKKKSKHHQNIQHLHPLESCGPSNHRSHCGFRGPRVLQQTKNRGTEQEQFLRSVVEYKAMNLKREQRSYCGRSGSGLISTLLSILTGSKTAISQMNWRVSYLADP